MAAAISEGHLGWFVILFVGDMLLGTLQVVFVLVLRVLSAGHARLLVDLEQRVVHMLGETADGDKDAFCAAVDEAESAVAGAMTVSNKKMQHVFWLAIVLLGIGNFTMIIGIRILASISGLPVFGQVFLLAAIFMLASGLWGLFAFLNLLRSVGDALTDLVEEMLKVRSLAKTSKFFHDPMCLALRFRDRDAARKLAWVIITDPVTSTTMYNAVGAVAISAAFVFLPGFLDSVV